MKDKPTPSTQSQQRVIRVFVSSTFLDMRAERDELVKYIFPQLRNLCAQRGVAWKEVDLRWGVTDEQKAEGKVLPICLAEIHRSRPYFIGLLGERYGSMSDEIPQELIEQEPWLEEYLNHSNTELEILHGVLRNPEMAEHAFFYFRDKEASRKVEERLAKEKDYKPESEESLKKLELLKERIEKSGFPIHKDYSDLKAFGQRVLEDLTKVINTRYPEGSQPEPLDRDASDHEAFAQSRGQVYIEREEYFTRLDEYVNGSEPPLVVLGESGSGKSALLANWGIKYRKKHPDILFIQHFIGATPYSTDWAGMVRRIMGEFKADLILKKRFLINQRNFVYSLLTGCLWPR